VTLEEETGSEPQVVPGAAVTGVAISEEELWRGGKEGVAVGESDPSGSPVLGFEVSDDGIAAVLAHGRVSVLAPAGVGISMAETEYTPVASFGPDGRLYVAEGYDANHIEELRALRPQPRPPGGGYQEDDILQTYVPGRDWWPEAGESEALYEEEPGLYVNDVASDGELLVAGGQDPSGDAAVMVWDAKTGKPLQHLSLGTGGVTTELPSIVSEVMLLPGKHEIAAYSATQELVAIWSTDTWELEDSVPIGAAGGLSRSPDEETIVAVGIGEDDEGYVEPDERTDLTFVDVDSGQVTDKVPARGVTELAFSPDGSTLALGDVNGFVRFRSADGRSPAGPLVGVKGGIEALAWQPDGALLAVALSQGGVVLVDPESGQFSEPLPHESFSPTVGLSWSEDGNMLAALNPLSEEESEGSAPDPGPAAIWTIGAAALERRMCELAACQPEAASASSQLGDASQLPSVDVVFQAEGGLLAADTEGDTARIGWLEEYPSPTPAYSWSASGFAWSSPGRIGVLLKGEEKPRSWPCACSGVAWSGGEVLSLDMNGKSLVRIDPERGSVKTTPVDGVPSYVPTLLGAVDGTPIAAAYEEEPSRATPSALFELQPDGTARKLIGDAHGSLYLQWPSSSPHTLAFVTYLSGGACYSFANVGVVSRGSDGRLGVDFPASPLDEEEPNSVRSLQVATDGSVSAAIARIGCDKDGVPEDEEPPADRYVLEGSRWRATGEEGYDVQAIGGGPDLIEESEGFGKPGTLFVVSDGEREELASDVERAVARP
jgi:anaphase-promoting complex subunit 4